MVTSNLKIEWFYSGLLSRSYPCLFTNNCKKQRKRNTNKQLVHLWAVDLRTWGVEEDELCRMMLPLWSQWCSTPLMCSLLHFQSAAHGFTHSAFHDVCLSPLSNAPSQNPSCEHALIYIPSKFMAAAPVSSYFHGYVFVQCDSECFLVIILAMKENGPTDFCRQCTGLVKTRWSVISLVKTLLLWHIQCNNIFLSLFRVGFKHLV